MVSMTNPPLAIKTFIGGPFDGQTIPESIVASMPKLITLHTEIITSHEKFTQDPSKNSLRIDTYRQKQLEVMDKIIVLYFYVQ